MSEPKSAAEVLEWLMEAADLDTGFPTKDQAQAIWNLMRHPATTRLMLAVQAWERGENYAKVKTEADALKARLAAAEARAERAVGMLGDARKCVSLVNVNGYYDNWLARCYALLKEVSHEG